MKPVTKSAPAASQIEIVSLAYLLTQGRTLENIAGEASVVLGLNDKTYSVLEMLKRDMDQRICHFIALRGNQIVGLAAFACVALNTDPQGVVGIVFYAAVHPDLAIRGLASTLLWRCEQSINEFCRLQPNHVQHPSVVWIDERDAEIRDAAAQLDYSSCSAEHRSFRLTDIDPKFKARMYAKAEHSAKQRSA